jgi:hypothetical protein
MHYSIAPGGMRCPNYAYARTIPIIRAISSEAASMASGARLRDLSRASYTGPCKHTDTALSRCIVGLHGIHAGRIQLHGSA